MKVAELPTGSDGETGARRDDAQIADDDLMKPQARSATVIA